MARIPETFNFGEVNDFDTMKRLLQNMYSKLALAINGVVKEPAPGASTSPESLKVPTVYVTDSAPPSNGQINRTFEQGDIWIDRSASPDKVYFLTARTNATTVTWTAVN